MQLIQTRRRFLTTMSLAGAAGLADRLDGARPLGDGSIDVAFGDG